MNNKLRNKTRTPCFIIALLIMGITFFTFFHPMKRELENSYLQNFRLLAESKAHSVYTFIEKSLDGAKSLSSRTMIRNEIIKYKSGDISIDELKDYTKLRYEDGAIALDDLTGALRVVDNEIIAGYGVYNLADIERAKEISHLTYDIIVEDEGMQLIISSPIIEKNHVVGRDIVYFNKSKFMEKLGGGDVKTDIINGVKFDEIINYDETTKIDDKTNFVEHDENIGYVTKLDEIDKYIYTYIQKDVLYKPIKRVAAISHTGLALGILVLFITINHIVIKNANKILSDIENSRDQYKERAYRDSLTGVRSRLFLDNWINDNLKNLDELDAIYSIAMIDGDNFKEINDNYGHSTGDKVLTKIAEVLKKSVRQNDIIIRYGGDEFLIIFENVNSEVAESILKRVEEKLIDNNEFDFNITISYGISEIRNSEDFFEALNKADEKMYHFKHSKTLAINQTSN